MGEDTPVENDSIDNALVLLTVMTEHFIEQFAALNIDVSEAKINDWFNADRVGL